MMAGTIFNYRQPGSINSKNVLRQLEKCVRAYMYICDGDQRESDFNILVF